MPVLLAPKDKHNAALIENAHPSGWKNPEPASSYNLVVIGGGTAGLVTAAGAAGLGAKVALVEKNLMGGDCLNFGCVPSKALIRSARAAHDAKSGQAYGVSASDVKVDFPKIMERVRKLRAEISENDSAKRFKGLGVDVFLGEAKFKNAKTVEVDGKKIKFSKAVIATGARPAIPDIPGLKQAEPLSNETVFSLTELPARLAVIGGGPIGCELAQAFARLGSQVTLFQSRGQILPKEEPETTAIVAKSMTEDGVKIILEAKILEVSNKGREKTIQYQAWGKKNQFITDEILIAAGRVPNIENLNLEAAGVRFDKKRGIEVNDFLQSSNPRIYAAGDVAGLYQFTHAADAMARVVIQNALFLGKKKASALVVPWCTYTSPEIAHVGLYEKDAAKRKIPVTLFTQKFETVDRAALDGEEEGLLKIIVRKDMDKILGATLVAQHAGDIISEITLAMNSGLGLKAIAQTIHPYPTQAESIKKIADAYNRTRLTPQLKSVLQKWLNWTR